MSYEFGITKTISGVVWGVVTDNKHPGGRYMVKCKLPWIKSSDVGDDTDFSTNWCKVMTPMAGGGRGFYCLPEVGDEVVLAPIHGSIRQMVVLGSVWSETDKMPTGDNAPANSSDPDGNDLGVADSAVDNNAAGGKNNARFFISRSGSTMLFDDTEGKEKIAFYTAAGSMMSINDEKKVVTMYDADQETYLLLDATNKKIRLECKNGDIDILCEKGTFTLKADKIVTEAKDSQDHKAKSGKWKQESGGTMDLKAGGTLTEKAPKIDMNP